MINDGCLIPLIEKEDLEYGLPQDFNHQASALQMHAVRRALSECDYKALSYEAKKSVQEELVATCVEIYDCWKQDDNEFELADSKDMSDMVWMLKKYIDHVLSESHQLTMEQ